MLSVPVKRRLQTTSAVSMSQNEFLKLIPALYEVKMLVFSRSRRNIFYSKVRAVERCLNMRYYSYQGFPHFVLINAISTFYLLLTIACFHIKV